jgi:hypothetical protein
VIPDRSVTQLPVEQKLLAGVRLTRTPSDDANFECWKLGRETGRTSRKGIAVTFIVHASRGGHVAVTVRLSVVVAIAKGRSLLEEGWDVFITGPDDIRYDASEFDKLLLRHPALRAGPG